MSVVFLMRYVLLFVRKSGEVDPFTAFYPLNFEQIDRIQKPTFLNSNSTWKTVNEEPLLRYDNTYSHLFIYFIYFFVYLFIYLLLLYHGNCKFWNIAGSENLSTFSWREHLIKMIKMTKFESYVSLKMAQI